MCPLPWPPSLSSQPGATAEVSWSSPVSPWTQYKAVMSCLHIDEKLRWVKSSAVVYYSKYFLLLVWFVCTADSSIKIQLSWTWLVCFYIVILSLAANSQPAEPASGRESCSLESIQQIHPPPSPCNANSVPAPASHIKQTTKWKDITEWGINDWDLVVSE